MHWAEALEPAAVDLVGTMFTYVQVHDLTGIFYVPGIDYR